MKVLIYVELAVLLFLIGLKILTPSGSTKDLVGLFCIVNAGLLLIKGLSIAISNEKNKGV